MATKKKPETEVAAPKDIKVNLKAVETALEESKQSAKVLELVAKLSIDSNAQYTHAVNAGVALKERMHAIEELRDAAIVPIKQGLAVMEKIFKSALLPLAQSEEMLKEKLRTWVVGADERAEVQRTQAIEVARLGDEQQARQLLAGINNLLPPTIAGLHYVPKFEYEILDESKLPKEFLMVVPNEKAIAAAVKEHGLRANIPGVLVTDKRTVVITPSKAVKV